MTPKLLLYFIIAQNHCANTLPKSYENFIYAECVNKIYMCLVKRDSLESCVVSE